MQGKCLRGGSYAAASGEEAGYEIVPFEPGADVYVINTCTVTNIADRKSRQMLHKAKKMNPDAVVVATGCYVQTDEGKLEKDEAVDLVLGNNQKKNIVEVLAEYEAEHQKLGPYHQDQPDKRIRRTGNQPHSRACACLHQGTGWV